LRHLFTKTATHSARSYVLRIAYLTLTIFSFCIQNSFAQFITDVNYEFHDEIKSALDSIHSKDYSKVEFTGFYKERLFGKTRCVMSFTFLNDSIFWYKETFPGSRYGLVGDSSYYVRKYGWYFKSDKQGNIILKNRPPYYLATVRDSVGYLILIEKSDTANSRIQTENTYKSVYNPQRKLVEAASTAGSPLHFQLEKYQYIGDTMNMQSFSGLTDNISLYDSKKIITEKKIKKKKIIEKNTVTVLETKIGDENQTNFVVKKYNRDKKIIQIKFRYYHILFLLFPPDHLNIKYYKNTP